MRDLLFPYTDPAAIGLSRGARGPSVNALQAYLQRFGYLPLPAGVRDDYPRMRAPIAPAAEAGRFDSATELALKTFQRFFRLPETGTLDHATAAVMARPRCGVPDLPAGPNGKGVGDAWPTKNLRYTILNGTPDLPPASILGAVSQAFSNWANVSQLTFTGVPPSENPELRISFQTGDHGDGSSFDGAGGILAHAFYPPPNPTPDPMLPGDTHFDDAETWSVTVPPPPGACDLCTIALHEFGHALGLAHSNDPEATMFPTYAGPRCSLGADDIRRIQQLYGAPLPPPLPPPPPWNNPAIRSLIDEWLQQTERCARRVYPATYVDRFGRLCGETPTTTLKCVVNPNGRPYSSSYEYVWLYNHKGHFYAYNVHEYVNRRLAGTPAASLGQCRIP
jgi:peptidoglycan hydrolase-like protein with peptidoglycan-binding domain